MNTLIQHIIQQLEEVQTGKLWMGANYTRKLAQIDAQQAFFRPLPNLHSVAEIISHLTLWRNETILKIKTGKGSKTDDCEENWLPDHKLKLLGWDKIKTNYNQSLTEIITLLSEKEDSFLKEKYYDTDFKGYYNYEFVLNGMLHHDIYHLGQIGIVIKFLNEGKG